MPERDQSAAQAFAVPDEPAEVQQARDEASAEDAKAKKSDRRARHEDIRVNMLRSVVAEPLLSAVRNAIDEGRPHTSFDVIISLNEFFREGMARAQQMVEERAKQLGVRYALASH